MNRTAFVAAAMLAAAMGSASAGSDHYGADGAKQPAAGADHMTTSSIRERGTSQHQAPATAATSRTVVDIIARHNDDGLWGR
ncbi:DUF680 domain-containing protein [Mesorhizobium sp. M2A.F.Ca.ET.043.05.1.1]|uniref:DUF680 domain-containing protein n=1 Tax=Mesorhizobium sp. M2A.F.Ca.ET.043.05.1.1 TaxID=2493671 RepID=UPI000F752AAF|nr:DUF680 domain-containing protein [Mesorhizobium sp. M2A.F.Ca.ET.043.05.1.1]AZO15696.1 DUF680 domain-containing protein [Mesorhizobium sp. M2A.F.Ca.ET.043.05.1.1]